MVEYDEIMETNIQPKVRFEFLVFFYSLYLSLILVCFPCFPVVVDDVVVVVVVVVVDGVLDKLNLDENIDGDERSNIDGDGRNDAGELDEC